MDEQQAMAIVANVMSDQRPLQVTIDIKAAWLLISGLQLVTRHSGIGEQLRQELTHIALQFQDRIIDEYPEAAPLLQAGWDPAQDVG